MSQSPPSSFCGKPRYRPLTRRGACGLIGAMLAAPPVIGQVTGPEVTLRFHHFLPANSNIQREVIAPWIREIARQSDGRLAIEVHPAMSLGGAAQDLARQVESGDVDIALTLPQYTPGRFPVAETPSQPFMMTSAAATSRALYRLMQEAGQAGRIRDARWPLVDAREVGYDHPLHRPQVFAIRHDRSPAFFDPGSFPWAASLEGQFAEISREIVAALDVGADGRPYLDNGRRLEGEQWRPLVNTLNWASVHLYSRGVANNKVVDKFPVTRAALSQVPLATRNGQPDEVFISVLAPHTRIPEHYGVSSAVLTVHLPIVVPPGCGLRVHEETRTPEEGRLLIFDDTWQHSAWNDSDRQRVVLIFELWHPDLSEPEKRAIARTFEVREQWLRQRRVD